MFINVHYSIGSIKSRVVRSIADNIIYNVSNGGFLRAETTDCYFV